MEPKPEGDVQKSPTVNEITPLTIAPEPETAVPIPEVGIPVIMIGPESENRDLLDLRSPPPMTDAEYNCIMLRENKPHLRDPPPKMDFKYGSTCYPKECDREVIVSREGTDPVHVMAGINVRQQVREKSRYLNAKEVVWMQQATQRRVSYCRICMQHRGMDGTLRIYNHRHYSSFVDRIFAHVDSYGRYFCIRCN